MKKNYWYIVFFAAFAFLMMSCADDEIIETPSISSPSKTIAFNADIEWPEPDQTRSASPNRVSNFSLVTDTGEEVLPCGVYVQDGIYPNNDEKPLSRGAVADINSIGSFNVWATYTNDEGSSSAYFSNLEFEKGNGGVFSSGTTYYWPGSGTIDFVAVANTPSSGFTPVSSDGKLESFTYTVPTEATDQSDIIVATAKNVAGNNNASVPLSFKHIMSAVNVQIGKVVKGEIRSITFKNVYNKGEYLVDQGVWVVDKTPPYGDFTVTMEGGKFDSSGTDKEGTPVNTKEGTFMFIPQNPGDDAEMVIEFYDSETGHLYSDEAGAYKPALRGSIAGDNWDMSKTVNYMLSIDESFTLTIEPVGKKLDAHYVIGYANVTVEGIDNWTIEVSSDVSSAEPITIQPEEEVNPLAKQGFWTDKVVHASGNITAESARGSQSWSGTGDVTNKLFYIFIPENVSDKDRQISLTLSGTDGSPSTTKVLLQKYPNWTAGGFGWEVVDDDESGEYGFKWTRKVVYQFYQNHGEIFGIGTDWTGYTRTKMLEFINAIVAPYNNGNALTVGASDSWIYLTETEVNSYSFMGFKFWAEYKMNVHIDYTKLNNITTALSVTDGLANSKALYQLGGSAATSSLETVLQESTKTENTDPAFTITSQDGSLNDLSGILTYIQKKNKYNMQIVTTEVATTPHPIFNVDDLKWYLPAYGQFQYFTPDPNIAGDDKSHYWSSTAVSGSSEAYIGDGTSKDRDLQYRVIAVRKKEN